MMLNSDYIWRGLAKFPSVAVAYRKHRLATNEYDVASCALMFMDRLIASWLVSTIRLHGICFMARNM